MTGPTHDKTPFPPTVEFCSSPAACAVSSSQFLQSSTSLITIQQKISELFQYITNRLINLQAEQRDNWPYRASHATRKLQVKSPSQFEMDGIANQSAL